MSPLYRDNRSLLKGDAGSQMGLNFSNATPEMTHEGVRRLSIAVAHEVEHCQPAAVITA